MTKRVYTIQNMDLMIMNGFELECLDDWVCCFVPEYIMVFDKDALEEIKKQHKELIEEKLGMKVIWVKYSFVPDLQTEYYRLFTRYYLVDKGE